MNIMDREKLLAILNRKADISSYIELLVDYCVEEHKKPIEDTKIFIDIITKTHFFSDCLNTAIEYYEKKFNIVKVIDTKTNNTILIY